MVGSSTLSSLRNPVSADWNERWLPSARKVAQTATDNFLELVKISSLDPTRHFRFADWAGLNFEGCDLRGFDFTGACLNDCNFAGARIAGARFDQALIGGSNLRAARDWTKYVKQWQRPAQLISDDHLPAGAVFQDAPFAPELVVIAGGEFMMGSPEKESGHYHDEAPQHKVTIPQPLAVGRYAVTFEEWDIAQTDKDWRRITGLKTYKPQDLGWGRDRRPVINVNWDDAQGYLKWLRAKTGKDYRLLSEAEWEYAARAGTDTPFWWGPSISPDQASYDGRQVYEGGGQKGECCQKTVPVDEFKPNGFGLYQVHGNVYEWVEDGWHENYNGAPEDGSAWISGDRDSRVLRGGTWISGPGLLRAASRFGYLPGYRGNIVGFRLARTLNL